MATHAKRLEVLGRRVAAVVKRNDVIALQPAALPALHALPAVALKNLKAQRRRDGAARVMMISRHSAY